MNFEQKNGNETVRRSIADEISDKVESGEYTVQEGFKRLHRRIMMGMPPREELEDGFEYSDEDLTIIDVANNRQDLVNYHINYIFTGEFAPREDDIEKRIYNGK